MGGAQVESAVGPSAVDAREVRFDAPQRSTRATPHTGGQRPRVRQQRHRPVERVELGPQVRADDGDVGAHRLVDGGDREAGGDEDVGARERLTRGRPERLQELGEHVARAVERAQITTPQCGARRAGEEGTRIARHRHDTRAVRHDVRERRVGDDGDVVPAGDETRGEHPERDGVAAAAGGGDDDPHAARSDG